MKRFSYVILGLLTLFGAVVFTACNNKPVSLQVDAPQQGITIYTNDASMENQEQGIFYQQAEFDVSVANSSAQIVAQTESGLYDVLSKPEVVAHGGGLFTVKFSALKSGSAKLVVIAENTNVSQKVDVNVFTRPSKLVQTTGTGLKPYVLKGECAELDIEKLFTFPEDDVNLLDKVEWAIETPELENFASIITEDGKTFLQVSEDVAISSISLRATLTHNNESQLVEFKILDKSAITSLSLQTNQAKWQNNKDENPVLQSGAFEALAATEGGDYTVFLKRNDSNFSFISGTLMAQVPTSLQEDDFNLVTGFYTLHSGVKTVLDADVWNRYFQVDITSKTLNATGTLTYNFSINAYADNGNWNFANDIYFYAGIRYLEYGYEVTTDPTTSQEKFAKINLQTSYMAQRMEISRDGADIKNNIKPYDVFSTYTSTAGFEIAPLVLPDEIALDDSRYQIVLDLSGTGFENTENVSDVLKVFLADGTQVEFEKSDEAENTFVSQAIESDSRIFLRTGDAIESELTDFNILFRSCSNAVANANLKCNLYHISTSSQGNLAVEFLENQPGENFVSADTVYASSSPSSTTRTLQYKLKVTGISSIAGLSISTRSTSNRFVFSPLSQVESSRDEQNQWVVFTFSVALKGTNFEDNIAFTLVHTTGIAINKTFVVNAFIPMDNVSVQNGSIQPANVYVQKFGQQSFVQNDDRLYNTPEFASSTLEKLTMEAGSSIALLLNHQTLSSMGIEFRYLDFDVFAAQLEAQGVDRQQAEDLFYGKTQEENDYGILRAADMFAVFQNTYVPSDKINITTNRLTFENTEFRGYLAVLFHGFDQFHATTTFVRIFAVESMYGVQTMYPTPRSIPTLFTTESLSDEDLSLASATVEVALRRDGNTPTYTKATDASALSRFVFESFASPFDSSSAQIRTTYRNEYYQISSISLTDGGQALRFVVTANSTKLQSQVDDEISVAFTDPNGIEISTNISLTIQNMQRVENVQWTNRVEGQEDIYLNLTSQDERTATISTSVSPVGAHNKQLNFIYSAKTGSSNIVEVKKDTIGQTFNLSISSTTGGTGTLYLLPSDMIKNGQILVYKYIRSNSGRVLQETPILLNEKQFALAYDDIVGIDENDDDAGEYSNYFISNSGEKVYNSNIILKIDVIVADGLSEETAIRLYTADELYRIDTSKFYRVMNNLTLDGWHGFENAQGRLSGMIAGNNQNVTITLRNATAAFVANNEGTIKNLTFVGNVRTAGQNVGENAFAGFVANINSGTIENVFVDVVASAQGGAAAQAFLPSVLSAEGVSNAANTYFGGIVGQNSVTGQILNSFVLGQTISAAGCTVGGIAGQNSGTISGCGVEFYRYESGSEGTTAFGEISTNALTGASVGGLVGKLDGGRIENSYAYSYPYKDSSSVDVLAASVSTSKDAFAAVVSGGTISQSFAFVGASAQASANRLQNCYVSLNGANGFSSTIYISNSLSAAALTSADIPTSQQPNGSAAWVRVKNLMDPAVWQTQNIDSSINFGYFHLKNVLQSQPVDLSGLTIKNNTAPFKSLGDGDGGVLMFYRVSGNTSLTNSQRSQLEQLNTLDFADLFQISGNSGNLGNTGNSGTISARQARSLVVGSSSLSLVISSTNIQVSGRNVEGFTLSVHNKMDLSTSKNFSVTTIYALPKVETFVKGEQVANNQLVQIQNQKTVDVRLATNSKTYLGGQEFLLESESYAIDYEISPTGFVEGAAGASSTTMALMAKNSHSGNAYSTVTAHLQVQNLGAAIAQKTNQLVRAQLEKTFNVQVYDGATAIAVQNANNLQISPKEAAPFDVVLTSDNANDGLIFELVVDGQTLQANTQTDAAQSNFVFEVDEKLFLQISWVKTQVTSGQWRFRVTAKILDEKRHLLDKNYDDITLVIYPKTQQDVQEFRREVKLAVKTQDVSTLSLTSYRIASRTISGGTTQFAVSREIVHDVVPGSDSILAVQISPAFAMMSHFTLSYDILGTGSTEDGRVGSVSLAKLSKQANGNFVIDSTNSTPIANGIWVNLNEADKMGDGYFYFRVYVSNNFSVDCEINFTLQVYNGQQLQRYAEKQLGVDYMHRAEVLVDGANTTVLAKGDTATVTVAFGIDQTLSDIYIENFGEGISLILQAETSTNLQKILTYSLAARVTARLESGSTGVFYVTAQVERVVNGQREIKTSRASICLVDFAIDGANISVASSGEQTTYQGQTYDVFHTYVGREHDQLYFNYPMLPRTYTYNPTDQNEAQAVESLMQKRNLFTIRNTYKDDVTNYYINYERNENTGLFEEQTLKEQLWLYSGGQFNAIYNSEYDRISGSDYFDIAEREVTSSDGNSSTVLEISGIRRGTQLMRLDTVVIYEGLRFVYEYYFVVVVDIWSDEEAPTQIFDGAQFVDYLTTSEEADDYILMDDITLNDYTPLSTNLVSSLDGNGFTININSFAPQTGSDVRYAMFDIVDADTTLKNVRVNIYTDIKIDIFGKGAMTIDVAGFAIENNGIIYNCEVVSYFGERQVATRAQEGLIVRLTKGENGEEVFLTSNGDYANINSHVSGFVGTNTGSITNSRVGGESFKHVVSLYQRNWLKTQSLNLFTLQGQGVVAGFVGTNSGYISASYADNIQITNKMNSTSITSCITAGFVVTNTGSVQTSYVEGAGKVFDDAGKPVVQANESNISAIGNVAAFVYENSSVVKNCYANIGIENSTTKPHFASGFVYTNNQTGQISLCFTASTYLKQDGSQLPFSGADDRGSRNFGTITTCYFFNNQKYDDTTQNTYTTGATPVAETLTTSPEDALYGFSFSSGEGAIDGIWQKKVNGITLASANQIAISNRYAQTTQIAGGDTIVNMFYNRTLVDADTLQLYDLSYGSANNPIIIRSAEEFAMAMGHANANEYSYYREYYNNTRVWGNYRVVKNLNLAEIDQNGLQEFSTKLTSSTKTFAGLLDGNGFSVDGINLVRNTSTATERVENFGLFAKLENAIVMGLDLRVDSITNGQANIVGTLAGTAVNSKIVSIQLSPMETSASNTNVFGRNVVGGVVGMLFGNSKLMDVSISNINVYSTYGDVDKNPASNDAHVGQTLRSKVLTGASLQNDAEQISYTGAMVGYVDTYQNSSNSVVKFSNYHSVSNYDVVKVAVSGSVSVYGEVVGGLFGYVGTSTYVYDASVLLSARDDRDFAAPSYIISRNLYAGGVVGENYGGLFAVQAAYENDLQTEIETNAMHEYYNGSTQVERGQGSIFSYDKTETESLLNTSDPLYVGGIVGKMSGGYIYVGVSKLNVVSHSTKTLAVGGVVGLASQGANSYELSTIPGAPNISFLLQDVYASGDLYADKNPNASSGGIIGALLGGNVQTPVLALRNVLAENYYSYENGALLGENHFTVMGKVYNLDKNVVSSPLSNAIYIINNQNAYLNVASGLVSGEQAMASATVGGYTNISLGNQVENLQPYGFSVSWQDSYVDGALYGILQTKHIGSVEMSTMPAAYRQNYRYFLENGWSAEYWVHSQDELFPHIQLVDRADFIFWDQFNTDIVLDQAKESDITIVVRGKVRDDEYDTECGDIDLMTYAAQHGLNANYILENFKGRIYSYYDYMGAFIGNLGSVNVINDDQLIKRDGMLLGGQRGDKVGLVMDRALFNEMDGVQMYGLNLYFAEKQGQTNIDYNISYDGQISNSIIQNTRLVYDANVSVSTHKINGEAGYAGGVVTGAAISTSFSGVEICIRSKNDSITPTIMVKDEEQDGAEADANVYMGVLAGLIRQDSRYTNVLVFGITFTRQASQGGYESYSNRLVPITFQEGRKFVNLFAGLYAGRAEKAQNGMFASITLGLGNVGEVDMTLQAASALAGGASKPEGTIYLGGYVGQISSVDSVQLTALQTVAQQKGITIKQKLPAKTLYAGLCFGEAQNSSLAIQGSVTTRTALKGVLLQGENVSHEENYVGGFAGKINVPTNVSGFALDFIVAKDPGIDAATGKTKELDYSALDKNLYDYTANTAKLSSYQISGGKDNYFGGLFGYVSGVDVALYGDVSVEGAIDLEVDDTTDSQDDIVCVGGVIGRTMGGVVCSAYGKNTLDIVVRESENCKATVTAHVGGVIGEIAAQVIEEDEEIPVKNILFGQQERGQYDVISSNVVANVDRLIYGGAIGYVQANAIYNEISIANVAYGGAVKVFGKNTQNQSAELTVGGIVGQFDWQTDEEGKPVQSQTEMEISNCLSYGDVFVIYPQAGQSGQQEGAQSKLGNYNFGGIVGSAPARTGTGEDAKGLTISNCSSLQTSFNSRLTKEIGNYHVGAIVGANADEVTYSSNTYSSGVNLCYQEQEGNQDLAYGTTNTYMGYVGNVAETETAYLSTNIDILRNFENLGSTKSEQKAGQKLNPFVWNNDAESGENGEAIEKQIGKDFVVATENLEGSETNENTIFTTHGIGWIANNVASGAEGRKTPIADDFTNLVFVGNGQTMKFEIVGEATPDTEGGQSDENVTERTVKDLSANQDYGLVVKNLGNSTQGEPNFSVISSLIVDADVLADIPAATSQSVAFGGVAGTMGGNAFVYGVGVQGEISVGGKNNQLKLGGIVGNMFEGVIDQCYVDAQLAYRAALSGSISGVGTVAGGNGNTLINATYTSGQLQTYVNVPVYVFASLSGNNTAAYIHDLMDVYSNSQVERVRLDYNDATEPVFVNEGFTELGDGSVINASYSTNAKQQSIDSVSVAYWKSGVGNSGNGATSGGTGGTDTANNVGVFSRKSIKTTGDEKSLNTWYFNPYVNYGYASHGFGFLKNVTTYTREKVNNAGEGEAQKQINEYEYTAIAYADLMKNWNDIFAANASGENGDKLTMDGKELYLGVPNVGKFAQMVETVNVGSSGTLGGMSGNSETNYTKNFRFVLKYNMDMANAPLAYGTSIGKKDNNIDRDLQIDGNNVTLDFSKVSSIGNSLFGTVIGTIENLRLYNLNVNIPSNAASNTPFGTLAQTLQSGKLQNVAVVGSLTGNSAGVVLGGVVGSAESGSSLIAVESMVNVSGSNSGVYGGVVGISNGAKISYASNAGQVVANDNSKNKNSNTNTDYAFSYTDKDGKLNSNDDTKKFDVIVGGVVGASNGGSITHSYNINSALAGYTNKSDKDKADKNNCAGGIVGYATGDTEISNSYNSSLVGAGNYGNITDSDTRSEGFAFAGGIVGYGNGNGSTLTLNDNINSGKVEALGKMRSTLWGTYNKDHNENTTSNDDNKNLDYTVSATLKTGSMNINEFKYKGIEDLSFDVKLTINPNRNRLVYAYGVGFVVNLDENGSRGNKSTTDNIKNDGCIGQVEQTQVMTFDRQTVLDNIKYKLASNGNYYEIADSVTLQKRGLFDNQAEYDEYIAQNPNGTTDERYAAIDYYLPFWGAFNAESANGNIALNVSGYDSFGFPVRVYGVDRIARIYNDVYKVYDADWLYDMTGINIQSVLDVEKWETAVQDKLKGDYQFNQPLLDVNKNYQEIGQATPFAKVDWATGTFTDAGNVNNDIYRYYLLYLTSKYESYLSSNKYQMNEWYVDGSYSGDRYRNARVLKGQFNYNDSAWGDGTVKAGDISLWQNEFKNLTDDLSYQPEDFLMGQVTPYTRNTTFTGYDEILNGTAVTNVVRDGKGEIVKDDNGNPQEEIAANTGFGLVLCSAGSTDVDSEIEKDFAQGSDSAATEVLSGVQAVDANLAASKVAENITVNGQSARLVYNETALEDVFNQEIVTNTMTVDIDLSGQNITDISESSVKVALKENVNNNWQPLSNYTIISTEFLRMADGEFKFGDGSARDANGYLTMVQLKITYRAYLDRTGNTETSHDISAEVTYDVVGDVTLTNGNLRGDTLILNMGQEYDKLYAGNDNDNKNGFDAKLIGLSYIKQGQTEEIKIAEFNTSNNKFYNQEGRSVTVRVEPGMGEKATTIQCATFNAKDGDNYLLNDGDTVRLRIQTKQFWTVADVYANSTTTQDADTFSIVKKTAADLGGNSVTFRDYTTMTGIISSTTSGSSSGMLQYLAPNKDDPEKWEVLTRETGSNMWYYTKVVEETNEETGEVTQKSVRVYAVPVKARWYLRSAMNYAQNNDEGLRYWMMKTDDEYFIFSVLLVTDTHPEGIPGTMIKQTNTTDGVKLGVYYPEKLDGSQDTANPWLEISKLAMGADGNETEGLWVEPSEEDEEVVTNEDWTTLTNFVAKLNSTTAYFSRPATKASLSGLRESSSGTYGTWNVSRGPTKTNAFDANGNFVPGDVEHQSLYYVKEDDNVTSKTTLMEFSDESIKYSDTNQPRVFSFNEVTVNYNYNNITQAYYSPTRYANSGYELSSHLEVTGTFADWHETGFAHNKKGSNQNAYIFLKLPSRVDDGSTYSIKFTTTNYRLEPDNKDATDYDLTKGMISQNGSVYSVTFNQDYTVALDTSGGTLNVNGIANNYTRTYKTTFNKRVPFQGGLGNAKYMQYGYVYTIYERQVSSGLQHQEVVAMQVDYSLSLLDEDLSEIYGASSSYLMLYRANSYAYSYYRSSPSDTWQNRGSDLRVKMNEETLSVSGHGTFEKQIYVDVIGSIINPAPVSDFEKETDDKSTAQQILFARNNYQSGTASGNVNIPKGENVVDGKDYSYTPYKDKLKITDGVSDLVLVYDPDGEPLYVVERDVTVIRHVEDADKFVISSGDVAENSSVQYQIGKKEDKDGKNVYTGTSAWFNLEKGEDEDYPEDYVLEKDDGFGQVTYGFRYSRKTKLENQSSTVTVSGKSNKKFDYVVLQRDIRTGMSFNQNLNVLAGENHVVKIANSANGSALKVDGNDGLALNLTLVVAREVNDLNANVTTFADITKLSNVKVFGTYSNLTAGSEIVINPVAKLSNDSDLTSVKNIETYLTIFSKDGKDGLNGKDDGTDGANVLVKIVDLPNVTGKFVNSNILIGGDGGHGGNGIDGDLSAQAQAKGTDGKNAGKAGKVEIQKVDGTQDGGKYKRSGIDGMPGFGGNGANGRFVRNLSTKVEIVYGGGAPGMSGEFVESENKEGSQPTTQNTVANGGRKIHTSQFSGNGGTGGFGRVDPFDRKYGLATSYNANQENYGTNGGMGQAGTYWESGTANGDDSNKGVTTSSNNPWISSDYGSKIRWAGVTDTNDNGFGADNTWFTVAFGFTKAFLNSNGGNGGGSTSSSGYQSSRYDENVDIWKNGVSNGVLNAKGLQSKLNKVSKLNISMLAGTNVSGDAFWRSDAEMYRGVVWGSGEDINYGGKFIEANDGGAKTGYTYDGVVDEFDGKTSTEQHRGEKYHKGDDKETWYAEADFDGKICEVVYRDEDENGRWEVLKDEDNDTLIGYNHRLNAKPSVYYNYDKHVWCYDDDNVEYYNLVESGNYLQKRTGAATFYLALENSSLPNAYPKNLKTVQNGLYNIQEEYVWLREPFSDNPGTDTYEFVPDGRWPAGNHYVPRTSYDFNLTYANYSLYDYVSGIELDNSNSVFSEKQLLWYNGNDRQWQIDLIEENILTHAVTVHDWTHRICFNADNNGLSCVVQKYSQVNRRWEDLKRFRYDFDQNNWFTA